MSFSVILKKDLKDLDGILKKKLQELFPRNLKFSLIYRASDDGFGVADFHEKCDNVSNTLTIIESKESNVFGGFVKVEWDSVYSGYKSDPKAFIFSLINEDENPLIMECQEPDFATYNDNSLGPVFGAGMDIAIRNNSNENDNSSTRLGYSFKHPEYEDFSDRAKKFLAGTYYFQTKQIEVFSIKE